MTSPGREPSPFSRDRLSADELERCLPDPAAIGLVGHRVAVRHGVVPIGFDPAARRLTLALSGTPDALRKDFLLVALDADIEARWVGAPADAVARAIDRCYGAPLVVDKIASSLLGVSVDADANAATDLAAAAPENATSYGPIVRLVDALLHETVARGASDLHLSPGETITRVRCRIDGLLATRLALPVQLHAALVVRLKVMAGLDIAETRLPQDGSFRRFVRGAAVDFRLSSFPLITGESLVMRVLDASVRPSSLAALGLGAVLEEELRALLARPGGLVLVAGPTGSGKSTTLHALLAELSDDSRHVVTLEDPVEYPTDGISQASIDPSRKLDFTSGVRALLRQDPDVILIGEIRDATSCRMAFRAAMSGHRVLSSVHADDATAAVERLRELGAEPAVMGATLAGVAAQRLLRRPCRVCVGPGAARSECVACRGAGYAGRFALVEVLCIGVRIGAAIAAGDSPGALARLAIDGGFVPLEDAADSAVAAGRTTREEVTRVLGPPREKTELRLTGDRDDDGTPFRPAGGWYRLGKGNFGDD